MIHAIGTSIMSFVLCYLLLNNNLFGITGVTTVGKTPKQIEIRRLMWSAIFALAMFLMSF